ncbi:DUF3540 domain-containing protein [candidate division CSSED10-310 bacterium]|uniref:DUF3540 domain-containing protein n=1 Tax=candidate division CSSED10-310 bacterium TaxID=2855610 RepID=A0ABV6Z1U0_UNCC1
MEPKIIPFPRPAADCRIMNATVKGVARDTVIIDADVGVVNAEIAFSCLVAPEIGDKVLVSQMDREFHILAVLNRPARQDMTLDFPGNVKINTAQGQLDVTSAKDLNLIVAGKTRMFSTETHLTGGQVSLNADKLMTRANELESYIDNAKLFISAIDTVAKRVTQRVDTLMRWVEQVETLNIGNLIQNVRKTLTSHSHEAIITAKTDIRIDGERIHVG